MEKEGDHNSPKARKTFLYSMIAMAVVAVLCYLFGAMGIANLTVFIMLFVALNKYVFTGWIAKFQNSILPRMMNGYENVLRWMLKGRRPIMVMVGMVVLLFLSIAATIARKPKVDFFPKGDPNFIYTYIVLPVGTDQSATDSITRACDPW